MMTNSSRRGFTLIELIVALILLVLVGGSMYRVLHTVQRVTNRQTERASVQGNLRAGIQLVQSELQEIATNTTAGTSDLLSAGSSVIQYRAARGLGESCDTPTLTTLKIRKLTYSGLQTPSTNHVLYVFLDNDTTRTDDDDWAFGTVTGVSGSSTCPDGAAAWLLTFGTLSINSGGVVSVLGSVLPLSNVANVPSAGLGAIPVRLYETMEMGPVVDNGQTWLGVRSVSGGQGTLIPVIGPIASSGGVAFAYYDKSRNSSSGTPSAVTNIVVTLSGISARNVNTRMDGTIGTLSDALTIKAQLRNSQ